MTLTPQHVAVLKRPFTPEAVKWRADQKKPDRAGNVRCLVYLDSRLTIERLSQVDPAWTDQYKFLAGSPGDPIGVSAFAPVACSLTVHGVTRTGVGQLGSKTADGKYAKAAVSDALKRAGVQFGIGGYLYAMPVFKVDAKGYWSKGDGGDVGGLTPEGVKQLRRKYQEVVAHPKFSERHGEPIDYGDLVDDERSVEPEPERGELLAMIEPPAGRRVKVEAPS